MFSSMHVAFVGSLMALSMVQPQRQAQCRRNVRCPCGFASGGVTQERSCLPENYLDPKCCTNSRIPPSIVPLSPRLRNIRSIDLGGLSQQSGSNLSGVPHETGDTGQSTQQTYRSAPGGGSSGDDNLMSILEHSIKSPRAAVVAQTSSSSPIVVSSAPQVASSVNQSLELNSSAASVSHLDFKSDNRVIGGNESNAQKHAWLVFITFEERRPGAGTPICGGTLISQLFVLTTAHCFFETDGSRRRVKTVDLGRHDLNNNAEKNAFTRRARDNFVHPGYNQLARTQFDDIALIQLDEPSIKPERGVLPAFLPSDTEDASRFDDLWARVAGWGGQGPRETFNPKVRETCMQVKVQCCQHHFQNFVPSKQMCLLGPYYTDICAGDSGSPFVVQGFNGPTVIALVSYGSNECGDNKPTINTAVQHYVPWIKNILRENEPSYDLNLKRNWKYADMTCEEFPCIL